MPIAWSNVSSLGLSTKANRANLPAPAPPSGAAGAGQGEEGPPSPITVLLGIAFILVLLKFIGEHESTAIRPAHIHLGGYNLIVFALMTLLVITLMKLIFIRFTVPGISPLVKFI